MSKTSLGLNNLYLMCRERKIIVFLVRDVALWESAYVTCIGPWVRFTSTAKINRNIVPFSYLFVLFKDLFYFTHIFVLVCTCMQVPMQSGRGLQSSVARAAGNCELSAMGVRN